MRKLNKSVGPFVCIASGPSLTRRDCELVINSEHKIIAVNSSFFMVPECDHLFAADYCWWEKNFHLLGSRTKLWTASRRAKFEFAVNLFPHSEKVSFNSGQRAIQLAFHLGASKVILLGYDCSISNGTHWHGNHLGDLKNPTEICTQRWIDEFLRLKNNVAPNSVINCTRQTALTCFPCYELEEVLCK